ncbi:cleavage stimulation factor [Tubulinosema ratisbonensis]|uniref:Cleavage stimulation factor n=1 Tax=Tubulinosema ratisbonensis TaxID=291195 RepID=A0A437APU3_9MICR|nr:cleavage stimulation factor [Tubulinosema ratisbonensis]
MAHGCSVFVGNIDFEVPEEKIIEALSSIGRVVSFKMVYDRTTGKSKGYGFAEYESPIIAEQAVQSLKLVFNNRPVKINYAETDMPVKPSTETHESIDVEEIVNVVNGMDKDELKKVLLFLKRMAIDQPDKLKSILDSNKALIIALYQSLLRFKMVDVSTLEGLIKSSLSLDDKSEILNRINQMGEEDLNMYPVDVRERIVKLKFLISKKQMNEQL